MASAFKLRSGNSPLFKEMGSSPLLNVVNQTKTEADSSIVDAAQPEEELESTDYTIDVGKIDWKKRKKKEKKEEEKEENGQDDDNDNNNENIEATPSTETK